MSQTEGTLYRGGPSVFRMDTPQEYKDRFYFAQLVSMVSFELDNRRLGISNDLTKTHGLARVIGGEIIALNNGRKTAFSSEIRSALIEDYCERSKRGEIESDEVALKLTLLRNTLEDASRLSPKRLIELRDFCLCRLL